MNQTGSPSITTLITHIVLQEHREPLSQNLDAVKKPLILNKPTHHIMHVVYQQALCESLPLSLCLPSIFPWLALCTIYPKLFLLYPAGSLFQTFFSSLPWLFPPKVHTVAYLHYHFVLFYSLNLLSTAFLKTILPRTALLFLSPFLTFVSFFFILSFQGIIAPGE